MGFLIEQKPVKLIVSIIYKDEKLLNIAEKKLEKIYGFTENLRKTFQFDYTKYYSEEFGEPLKRKLICFKKLLNKEKLSRIKLKTNAIEDVLRLKKKRTINIDPGYVTEAKLVLLTTKDYTHRVYIGERIFAESTLFFQNNTFNSWPWTYPDYASEEMIEYFNKVRNTYMKDIRDMDQKTINKPTINGLTNKCS